MGFREEVEKRLQNLTTEQICQFAWLCGVRALPFLSAKREFACWNKDERQKHLYAIFNALDAYTGEKLGVAAHAAINAAHAANAAYAAYAAAYAAANATKTAASAYAATEAADANTATEAADAYAADTRTVFEKIILEDIEAIKNGNLALFNNDTSIYGKVWQSFLEDLNAIGCGYWAQLYENLFKNKFDIDKKELERRLSVPESIRSLGAKDVAASLTGQQTRLNEARVIILGEMGAGKTSMAKKLLNPEEKLSQTQKSTEGVDVFPWILESDDGTEKMNVHIWDFAGHSYTHTAHRYFLAERCVYVIVYDGRTESRNDLEKWLNHVKNYGGNSPVYVLVNLRVENPVEIDENMLLDKFPDTIKDFVYLSLQDDTGKVKEFREKVAHLLHTDPAWDSKIPEKWFMVKQKLENRFKNKDSELIDTTELIDTKTFNTIAKEAGVDDENDMESMKRALNALGICLWYDKIPNLQAYVLDPNWISHAVYKILNWLGKKEDHKYELHLTEFSDIFGADKDIKRYPKERHSFLFALLENYEMAYPAGGKENNWLVLPSMLSEKQPKRGMEDVFSIKDSLLMRYKVSGVMPLDTIARFIVRHHSEIVEENGKQVVWKRGVALQDKDDNYALVIEDGQEIRLSVKGKTALKFFEALRSSLNDIFKSYKSDNPELGYVITETRQNEMVYVPDGVILANERYRDWKTGKEIYMPNVVNQFNISGNAILDSPGSAIANNSPGTSLNSNITLHAKVNEEQFDKILEVLTQFLESTQAEDELGRRTRQEWKTMIEEARPLGHEEGWRTILTTCADLVTLGTPLREAFHSFLLGLPEYLQDVKLYFEIP